MRTRLASLAAAALSAAALGACGGGDDGPDRLSDQEYKERVNPAVQRISQGFGQVFAELGKAGEGERVPADVRERLRAAANTEREAVSEMAELEPPERAEAAHERLVSAGRKQAEQLEALAGQPGLTVGRMADAVEGGETSRALQVLAKGGWVDPPGHN